MAKNSKIPRVWELLRRFKETCHRKGWKTSQYEDVIKIDDTYHNFIGTRTIHPSTFRRIASSRKLAVPEGRSYRIVDVSYTAWVSQQPLSKQLLETLIENPALFKKMALYDLSSVYQGKQLCLKVNETESSAFTEFERFLKETYGVDTKPLYEPRTNEPRTFKSKLQKAKLG